MTILAVDTQRTGNDRLIVECYLLDYLRVDDAVLDPTYGLGTFWKLWEPEKLTRTDLYPTSEDLSAVGIDFRDLPYEDLAFDAVVFDPPYKLNGTPSEPDVRYGVAVPARWQERHDLIEAGLVECARVTKRHLLVKCMDQVVSGKVRWQTRLFADVVEACGFGQVDELQLLGSRAQPGDRRQVHARRNYSTMMVFERGLEWRARKPIEDQDLDEVDPGE